jgi:mycothiol synthase
MNTQLQNENVIGLPEGFTARGARMDDIESAMLLFNRWSRSVIGQDELIDAEVLRTDLASPGFDLAEDMRLVFAPDGRMVGYIEAWTSRKPAVHPWIWGRVDPDYEGLGIGTWLMHWAEARVLQILPELDPELRFAPRVNTYREAERPRKLFEKLGYQYIRSSYQMLIEMDTPVPDAQFPEGITLRTYNPGADTVAVYQAQTDSFRDHFGFVEEPLEEGVKRFAHFWEQGSSDPTLLFLAIDEASGEMAGINLCLPKSFDDPDTGWVGTLGVRRPWRKRGIALALLRHSFNEFYRRGKRKVGLGVDAQNLTGALRLYESAGMHVHRAFDLYEKELRGGTEISVQSLQE